MSFQKYTLFVLAIITVVTCSGKQEETASLSTNKSSVDTLQQDTIKIYPYRNGDQWVFVNREKEIVFPRWFESAQPFDQYGLALVIKNGKIGFIDTLGNTVIPLEYDGWGHRFVDGFTTIKKNGEEALMNTKGEIIVPFGRYESFNYSDRGQVIANSLEEKYMYTILDNLGNEVVPYGKYNDLLASRDCSIQIYLAQKDKKYGYIDQKGGVLIPLIYDDADRFIGQYAVVKKASKYGIINLRGELVIPFKYDKIKNYGNIHRFAVRQHKKWGIIDNRDSLIAPIIYSNINLSTLYSSGLFALEKEDKSGVMNIQGELISPFEYDEALDFLSQDGLMIVGKNGKYGVIDSLGNLVIPLMYDEGKYYEGIKILAPDLIRVFKNGENGYEDGKYGLVNRQNEIIVPIKYDKLSPGFNIFLGGLIEVELNGRDAYIDRFGNEYFEGLED